MGALLSMKAGWFLFGGALSRSLSGYVSYTLYIHLFLGVWRFRLLFRSDRESRIYQDSSHYKY